jgi:hypothetical protein
MQAYLMEYSTCNRLQCFQGYLVKALPDPVDAGAYDPLNLEKDEGDRPVAFGLCLLPLLPLLLLLHTNILLSKSNIF